MPAAAASTPHRADVPASALLHGAVAWFLPPGVPPPSPATHPGFVVRRAYDPAARGVVAVDDAHVDDSRRRLPRADQEELRQRLEETAHALGFDGNAASVADADQGPPQLAAAAAEPALGSPRTVPFEASEEHAVLAGVDGGLTGSHARDVSRVRLLEAVRPACESSAGAAEEEEAELLWPASAVAAAVALESAAHDELTDRKKYTARIRSLAFNLKVADAIVIGQDLKCFRLKPREHMQFAVRFYITPRTKSLTKYDKLVGRLVSGELAPATVLNMQPEELKEGALIAEQPKLQATPGEAEPAQMVDIACEFCGTRPVALKDIIGVSNHDRYQLECVKCGKSWAASRDAVSLLSSPPESAAPAAVDAALATSKFSEVEKGLHEREERPAAGTVKLMDRDEVQSANNSDTANAAQPVNAGLREVGLEKLDDVGGFGHSDEPAAATGGKRTVATHVSVPIGKKRGEVG
eukprot:SM000243S08570  [mRNA]  locus=s243:176726:181792:+ [translate_table: standard]